MNSPEIRPVRETDKHWIRALIEKSWHDHFVVAHGEVFYPADLWGFIAIFNNEPSGLVTYRINKDECEIVTIDSLIENRGFRISAIHHNAVDLSRKLKPSIPLKNNKGIPVSDEIEFEYIIPDAGF